MKKIMFFAAAVLAVLGCSKEKTGVENVPVMNAVTIRATAGEITKTTYAEEKTFAWEAGDKISVLGVKGSSMKFFVFETAESGASVDFTGQVEEGYELGDYAVYPETLEPAISGGELHITLPSELASASELKNLPLVGLTSGENAYAFKTATGIVKFTLENLWEDAATVRLTSLNEPLAGEFALAPTAGALTFDSAVAGEMTLKVGIEPDAAGSASFYVPVPEGSLAALDVTVLDGSGKELGTKSSTKEIVTVRNTVLPLKALPMRTWHIETLAGNGGTSSVDGIGTAGLMNIPQDIVLAPDGTYWFSQRNGAGTHGIRSFNKKTKEVKSIVIGSDASSMIYGSFPWGIAFNPSGDLIICCKGNTAANRRVLKLKVSDMTLSEYKPTNFPTGTNFMFAEFDNDGICYISDRNAGSTSFIYKVENEEMTKKYTVSGLIESMRFDFARKNLLLGGNGTWNLRSIDPATETVTVLAGGSRHTNASTYTDGTVGMPLTATLGNVSAICPDSKGRIFFTDAIAHTIRILSPGTSGYTDGTVKTILGKPYTQGSVDGDSVTATLQNPYGIVRVTDDEFLVVCGSGSNRIRRFWLE